MNILSLFDGISCGYLALQRAGIPIDAYYASEIDNTCIKVSQKHFPNIIQLGDVNNWRTWDIPWKDIDLVMGGFCCQSFSSSGKGKGFMDARGRLFFCFSDIVRHLRKETKGKVLFLGENVRMRDEHRWVIAEELGVEPVEIDSALVSAQTRHRLYWCNWPVDMPKDRHISLDDILEHDKDWNPGDTVMDPVAGSGTTGIAACEEGRDSLLVEIDRQFFDEMINRFNNNNIKIDRI